MLIGMCSAKGSPGVTVSALALTLAWAGPVLLAECDPAGGDLAAGFLRETPLAGRGLGPLGASLQRGRLTQDLWGHLVDLLPGDGTALRHLVLPGLSAPGQARTWTDAGAPGGPSGWHQLAALFTRLGSRPGGERDVDAVTADGGGWVGDVIADCGRLATADPAMPVLACADLVLVVARPVLPSVRAAAAGVADLSRHGIGTAGLLLVGGGQYTPAECARHLGIRLIATLPEDPRTAAVLSCGGRGHRGPLLRAAAQVAGVLAWTAPSPARTAPGRPPEGRADRPVPAGPALTGREPSSSARVRPGAPPSPGLRARPGEAGHVC